MEKNVEPQPPEALPRRKLAFSKWHIITVLLILVVALQTAFIFLSLEENLALDRDRNALATSLSNLQANYTRLQGNYSHIESEYNASIRNYSQLRDEVNVHSTHPTEAEKLLVTPDDESVQTIMMQVTGGWSNPSDWNEYWRDIKDLYGWTINNINYTSDQLYPSLPDNLSGSLEWSEDDWRFPNETLLFKQGDCEDQALLLLSLVRAYDANHPAYCIVVTGHVAMYIPVGSNQICILDSAGRYTTNDNWPNYDLTGKPVRQEISGWLSYVGGGAEVNWVFSDIYWRQFLGTEEFITWATSP